MARAVPLIFLLLLAIPVAASPVALRPGDPALDGKDYLISEADFRKILLVVRATLAREHPDLQPHRVHVISASKVEVYAGDPDEHGNERNSLVLTRSNGTWKVTGGGYDRAVVS
jgi:hypothetical protein